MTIKAVGYKTGLLSQKFIVNWALADLNIRGTFLEFKVLPWRPECIMALRKVETNRRYCHLQILVHFLKVVITVNEIY